MNTWLQGFPLSLSHTRTQKRYISPPRCPDAHVHQWKLVVFHGDDCSLQSALCESTPNVFTHKIPPPASWSPPGHHQSGPGVKIILSLVRRRSPMEGVTRQEGKLSRTWWNSHDCDAEYTDLFVTLRTCQEIVPDRAPDGSFVRQNFQVSSDSARSFHSAVLHKKCFIAGGKYVAREQALGVRWEESRKG